MFIRFLIVIHCLILMLIHLPFLASIYYVSSTSSTNLTHRDILRYTHSTLTPLIMLNQQQFTLCVQTIWLCKEAHFIWLELSSMYVDVIGCRKFSSYTFNLRLNFWSQLTSGSSCSWSSRLWDCSMKIHRTIDERVISRRHPEERAGPLRRTQWC